MEALLRLVDSQKQVISRSNDELVSYRSIVEEHKNCTSKVAMLEEEVRSLKQQSVEEAKVSNTSQTVLQKAQERVKSLEAHSSDLQNQIVSLERELEREHAESVRSAHII